MSGPIRIDVDRDSETLILTPRGKLDTTRTPDFEHARHPSWSTNVDLKPSRAGAGTENQERTGKKMSVRHFDLSGSAPGSVT